MVRRHYCQSQSKTSYEKRGKPTQSDINNLENKLAKCAAKIKMMEDMVKPGKNCGFLIITGGLSR